MQFRSHGSLALREHRVLSQRSIKAGRGEAEAERCQNLDGEMPIPPCLSRSSAQSAGTGVVEPICHHCRGNLAVNWLGVFFICLPGEVALHSSAGSADIYGFSVGDANSARIVCDFREGPLLRLVNYRTLDPDANTLRTRNFFVALRIHGKAHACAGAMGV
jgi:hypothetical protein